MQKLTIAALVTAALTFAAPAAPVAAHSAVVDQVLAAAAAQNPNAARVQQIMAIKREIEQGDKQALIGRVNQAVMDRMGKGDIAPVTAGAINGTDMRTIAENTVRQELQTRVNDFLAPYQPQINFVGGLLQAGGQNPDYRQLLTTALTTYLRS